MLALLGEVDARQLYASEGFSSLFRFATERLHLSESAAYSRITAARASRLFPVILPLIDEGAISLTTIALLSGHLTDENHESLLGAARGKSKRQVEQLVAALHPQPDIAASVRALPMPRPQVEDLEQVSVERPASPVGNVGESQSTPPTSAPPSSRALIAPIAPRRYLIRMTVGEETHEKLQRAKDLLRHAIPSGDPATIFDRALTALIGRTERAKFGTAVRPRLAVSERSAGLCPGDEAAAKSSRYVAADIRRVVWARDQGRCAFVGAAGRCTETGGLEFHHVAPFAKGGPATEENLELRCRTHNAFEATQVFGDWRARAANRPAARGRTLAGQS